MTGAQIQRKQVKLFRHKGGQAVPIPEEFELAGNEAVVRREGDRLVIEPVRPNSLLEYLDTLEPLDEDIGDIPDPLPEPVEL